eukprot:evm.model.scf_315.2 EVM.evm.TU.scf_315.2   scf_315:16736-21153(+)
MTPHALHIIPRPRGALRNLVAEPMRLDPPSPGHVLVNVKAVGINFRDVLNVLGMYPGDPGPPGGDCSGIIVDSAHDGDHVAGSYVFGLASGSLGSHVRSPASTLVPMPHNLAFEEAATAPTVFITGDIALGSMSRLEPQDRILVHAAAGGVGLAALQLANLLGAGLCATAGSAMKRGLLRSLGARHVFSSRDAKFAGQVWLCGGASVLINSLTSPGMVAASLSALKMGGRVVEISKRDMWSRARVSLERPDVRFNTLAVDFLPPKVINSSLLKIAKGLASGKLTPLPRVVHKMSSAVAALRQMSQARHVGKIVASTADSRAARPTGTVVITGGLGSLGLLLATWFARRGSSRLCLLGRQGRVIGKGLLPVLGSVSEVIVANCDVSREADLPMVHGGNGFGVETVIHASGVLRDATLSNQSASSIRRVFAPKATYMRSCMRGSGGMQPITSQIAFSSIASLLGSPGQVNYSASNADVDECASVMESQGLVCSSVQWGAWTGAGSKLGLKEQRNDAEIQKMRNLGIVKGSAEASQILSTGMAVTSFVHRTGGDALRSVCGRDATSVVPNGRWDLSEQLQLAGGLPVRFGVFMDEVDMFDARFFGMQDSEAMYTDPQQRLLMECMSEAVLAPGSKKQTDRARSLMGVYVGVSSMDYNKLNLKYSGTVTAYDTTGSSLSVASGRLSYTFGFNGPAVTIDTACSSSLVGLHHAINSIVLGQCAGAANCGVNLTLTPDAPAAFQRAGMLAADGRCKTLDRAADGYVRAEACGVMVIHPLGDETCACCAVVRGTAVNQDGRSSSLTAPNGPSQQRAILGALESFHAQPADVAMLQLHGTGTALGDPIEMGAAAAVFGDSTAGVISLAASKSWVGHSEPASGAVGVAHVQASLERGICPPILHLGGFSPHVAGVIGAAGAPGVSWNAPRQLGPRPNHRSFGMLAGASSFAFQGTNAHAILKQATEVVRAEATNPYWDKSRYWVTQAFGMFTARARVMRRSEVVFEVDMGKPETASMLDMVIAATPGKVLPLGLLIEMARVSMFQLDALDRGIFFVLWRHIAAR